MQIVHPICCGVDVHKKTIVATVATTDKNNITTHITETFSTLNPDPIRFRAWLSEHNCSQVCMESTGKYWIPVFNILEDHVNVALTHPKYVRAIKGKKTDKKDSKWISNLFKHDMIRFSFIPPKEVRAMRELARYRVKLVMMRSSEKNRYQNCMTVSNIPLANVLSDPFGKTASDIMQYVLSSDVFEKEYCKTLIHRSAKKKTELILQAVSGYNITSDQRFKMNESKAHMDYLDLMILKTEAELYTRMQPYYDRVLHISTLPGVSQLSAALIFSETGFDMSVFESAKHLVSWAGLAPAKSVNSIRLKPGSFRMAPSCHLLRKWG
jgi:transposase